MPNLLLALLLVMLSGCMKVSDMATGTEYQLRDAGVLDHSDIRRAYNWRLQPDSFIYIAQGPFAPQGDGSVRPNVVADEAFKGFVEYFPLVRRASGPLGLERAMAETRMAGAHYLLYCRFASVDDRIGTYDEWVDQEAVDRLGTDRGVIQLMLIEANTRQLVDTARIRNRGGLFSWYDSNPQDFIGPPLQEYARRLLGLNEQ